MNKLLNKKQERFCLEYIVDLNGTQAAKRAGYSEKTANEQAARLLADVSISNYVEQLINERKKRTEITADYVLETIQETVERCRQVAPVLNRKGEQVLVENRNGDIVPAFMFDSTGVLKGCELLGRHLKMFTDNLNLGLQEPPMRLDETPDNIAAAQIAFTRRIQRQ